MKLPAPHSFDVFPYPKPKKEKKRKKKVHTDIEPALSED